MKKKNRIDAGLGNKTFNFLNVLFMLLFAVVCLYPFIYVLALSFNDGVDAQRGGIYFWPRKFTFENYITVFKDDGILNAYAITLYRVVVGTISSVLLTAAAAYAMSRKSLPFKKFFNWLILLPMYFSGGLIPTYIIISGIGLQDNLLVYVIPSLYATFNIILVRTYMKGLPEALHESAVLDGANEFIIFVRLYLPLSMPVIATISLFIAVGHWNDWYTATIYTSTKELWPASTLLQNILTSSEISSYVNTKFFTQQMNRRPVVTPEALKMAMLIVTTVPIVLVYPFVQKYFVQGMMIGSLKE